MTSTTVIQKPTPRKQTPRRPLDRGTASLRRYAMGFSEDGLTGQPR